jgi:hypothetical protein
MTIRINPPKNMANKINPPLKEQPIEKTCPRTKF